MFRARVVFEEEEQGMEMESFDDCEEYDHGVEMADAAQLHGGCAKGHRPSKTVATSEGGSICLACLSSLLHDPRALIHHVSYALSQLSSAIRCPDFVRLLADHQPHLLVAPLVRALASFDDEPLARQLIDLISELSACGLPRSVLGDFVALIADLLSSGSLAWSRRQFFMLHCLGVLLNSFQESYPAVHIRDKAALFSTLIVGLQLPSEEIRGEILFVLYKLSMQQLAPWDTENNNDNELSPKEECLLKLSLESLVKTQKDDVRMNCVALLMVLAQKGVFEKSFENDQQGSLNREIDKTMRRDELVLSPSLVDMFADAIKGPLLSSDIQLQTSSLQLILHILSCGVSCLSQIQALIEANIADYVFEVLRLSGNKDSLIISCLNVLNILATVEDVFIHRLAVGFNTLLSVLRYLSEIPLHPAQNLGLKLVWICIENCPGILSISQAEEIVVILTGLFRRQDTDELALVSETFILACSTFVELLRSTSICDVPHLAPLIKESSRNAVISFLSYHEDSDKILYSLYFLKAVYICVTEGYSTANCNKQEIEKSIIETCETYLVPWIGRVIDEGQDEELALGIFEIFHLILLKGSEIQAKCFAEFLVLSSWFSLSFECLGLFSTWQIKTRIYSMLSSLTDKLLGPDFGELIRDCYANLPSDPQELVYLLGQNSLHDPLLASCQCAVLVLLHVSSLYGDRLTDGNQVLASLEQYILVNSTSSCKVFHPMMISQLVHLYALIRSDPFNSQAPYSAEVENSVFCLMAELECDLLSTGFHPRALKWLFQQEKIMAPLSYLILNFCRSHSTNNAEIFKQSNCIKLLDIQMIAELLVSGNNYAAEIMVSLLKESNEEDISDLVNSMMGILNVFPGASSEFSLHGIAEAFRRIFCCAPSTPILKTSCLFIFNVLYLANHVTLSQDEDWLGIVLKLLEHLRPRLSSLTYGQEEHLIMAIFSLILHYSTGQVLKEASKAILLDQPLASTTENIVQTICAKGSTLVAYDEDTPIGETLIFALLLYFFALKSLHAIFQENMDWQDFFQISDEGYRSSVICIKCHDICRLLHFGSSIVKLVSSQCLVELLTRIENHRVSELNCSERYLESVVVVTEGLLFCGDVATATACRVCLSILLECEKFGPLNKKAIRKSKWLKIVMEELAMTLTAPSMPSTSFLNQHKPAAHIAAILLKLNEAPPWMKSVFNDSCISGILSNLSACNLTSDMVKLFNELTISKYLNKEHVDSLHHLLQVCRKQVYEASSKEQLLEKDFRTTVKNPDDIGDFCNVLIQIMLSLNMHCGESRSERTKLLEEIDLFFQYSTTQLE